MDSISLRKSLDPGLPGITSSSASTLLWTTFCLAIICTPDNYKLPVLLLQISLNSSVHHILPGHYLHTRQLQIACAVAADMPQVWLWCR